MQNIVTLHQLTINITNMTMKRHFMTALVAALTVATAEAQDFYDITEYYIKNHDFTANVRH